MTASCSFLKGRFRNAEKVVVGLATSVETQGVDLRTRTKQLGAKERARRKKCGVRFSHGQEESGCSEELYEGGLGTRESVERTGRGHCARREVEVEEADGGSSGQERIGFVVSCFGGE